MATFIESPIAALAEPPAPIRADMMTGAERVRKLIYRIVTEGVPEVRIDCQTGQPTTRPRCKCGVITRPSIGEQSYVESLVYEWSDGRKLWAVVRFDVYPEAESGFGDCRSRFVLIYPDASMAVWRPVVDGKQLIDFNRGTVSHFGHDVYMHLAQAVMARRMTERRLHRKAA